MNKSPFPEANRPARYPILADFRLNAWAFVALLAAQPAHWVVPLHPDWPSTLRGSLVLLPLLPGFLWMRSIWRWINSLDEMQRIIQYEACFVAAAGTVFLSAALEMLTGAHVIQSVRFQWGLGWEGTFASLVFLYIVGCVVANRRYA